MAWLLVSISLIDLNHGRIILSWNHFWKIEEISCCFKAFWKSTCPRKKILFLIYLHPFPLSTFERRIPRQHWVKAWVMKITRPSEIFKRLWSVWVVRLVAGIVTCIWRLQRETTGAFYCLHELETRMCMYIA